MPKIPFKTFAFVIFTSGIGFSLVGAILPDFSAQFGLSNAEASKIPLTYFLGDMCGLLAVGFALGRPRLALLGTLAVAAPSALWVALAPSYSDWLLIPFFALGAVAGIAITLPSMIVGRVFRGESARMMSLMFGFFAAGVMIAPLGFGGLRALGLHYPAAYLIFAGLGAAAFLFALLVKAPEPDLGPGLMPRAVVALWNSDRKTLLVVSLMNALYVGSESVPNAWIPKYLNDSFPGGSEVRSVALLSLFWAGMTAGRFLAAAALKRGVSAHGMLVALLVLAAGALALAPWMGARLSVEALFASSGLFFSGVFPLIIAHTERVEAEHSGTLFVIVMAAGMLGASAVSPVVGWLAEAVGFQWGMMAAPAQALLALAMIPLLGKEGKSDLSGKGH